MGKHDNLKKNLHDFYLKNQHLERKVIYRHFINIGAPKRSLNRWLTLLFNKKNLNRKPGSGRKAKIATPTNIRRLKNYFNNKSGRSQTKFANRLKVSQQYVSKLLKKYTRVRTYKKTTRPLLTPLQKKAARPKCRKLLQKYSGRDFILDDESYFTLSNSTLAGNDRFYSDDPKNAPLDVRSKFKSKFEPKVLVWLAISPRGHSKALFFKSGLAINQYVYKNECLDRGLIPFIRSKYPHGNYVFWPDLASSHYANSVCEHLNNQNIEFVPKCLNPANVPKARPIEDFWGILKREVYKNNWKANSIPELKRRIVWTLSKIDPKLVVKLSRRVRARLEIVRKHGVDSL